MPPSNSPTPFADYLKHQPPHVRPLLTQIRQTIRNAVPKATEQITYRMPAFHLKGTLPWFAGFKHHIGMFPPISGNSALVKAAAKYAGPKGCLRFPLDQPIPHTLIARIARHRARQLQIHPAPRTIRKTEPEA